MTVVSSSWASTPVIMNGILSGPEWAGAGVMPIPAGFMMVKNDVNFLYVALDLVGDRGADPGVGDYFWFSVDSDGNGAITPNVDVNYGIYPSLPIRIGRQFYLGPGTWTGLLSTPSPAQARNGFGPSPHSPVPHRVWEMRLPLNEIGIASLGAATKPVVRFGLRVASSNPSFTFDFPGGFFTNFLNMNEILLSTGPRYEGGSTIIGGVGLIPVTQISNGYATTAPGYNPFIDEAAFGGVLNIIGNRTALQNLYEAGARTYQVQHRAGSSASFAPLLQSWQNYRWTGTTYALESFTWDSDSRYPMVSPGSDYSTDDLLIQWNTTGSVGIHEFRTAFFRQDGTPVPTPTPPQTLQLTIDNNLPLVDIEQVLHNGTPVSACAIETMTDAADGVRLQVTVKDLEGNLKDFSVNAYWGNGASASVYSNAYPAHRNPAHQWPGVNSLQIPSGEWTPPVSCAYEFRLSATPRVTNGYSYIGYTEDQYHLTLIKPGGPSAPTGKRLLDRRQALGQTAEGAPEAQGTVTGKLGNETFPKK